jgi:hypothetical protein
MNRKLMTFVGVAVAVSLISLLTFTSAFAAGSSPLPVAAGANPENALNITGNWVTLQPGASLWYGFQYTGDKSQIQVILNDQGQSGLALGVWTPARIAQMEAGQSVKPIGYGSPNKDVPAADLFWAGNFDIAAPYYVQVENNSSNSIAYSLSVTGSGVYMLPGAATQPISAPATPLAPAPAPAPAGGSNPETALAITGGSTTLQPGASLWFNFQYAGDKSQIQVILDDQGQSGPVFGVWTPTQIAQMEAGQSVKPIGYGSPNKDVPADLFWTGHFNIAAPYYVKIENDGTAPITFTLQVLGSGVWG